VFAVTVSRVTVSSRITVSFRITVSSVVIIDISASAAVASEVVEIDITPPPKIAAALNPWSLSPDVQSSGV
jgi:hypothetical protein